MHPPLVDSFDVLHEYERDEKREVSAALGDVRTQFTAVNNEPHGKYIKGRHHRWMCAAVHM